MIIKRMLKKVFHSVTTYSRHSQCKYRGTEHALTVLKVVQVQEKRLMNILGAWISTRRVCSTEPIWTAVYREGKGALNGAEASAMYFSQWL